MRMSQMLFFNTERSARGSGSGKPCPCLLKAGYDRRLAAGVYALMPLGFRVFKKIENIIREEMDKAGAQELIMSRAAAGLNTNRSRPVGRVRYRDDQVQR